MSVAILTPKHQAIRWEIFSTGTGKVFFRLERGREKLLLELHPEIALRMAGALHKGAQRELISLAKKRGEIPGMGQ